MGILCEEYGKLFPVHDYYPDVPTHHPKDSVGDRVLRFKKIFLREPSNKYFVYRVTSEDRTVFIKFANLLVGPASYCSFELENKKYEYMIDSNFRFIY